MRGVESLYDKHIHLLTKIKKSFLKKEMLEIYSININYIVRYYTRLHWYQWDQIDFSNKYTIPCECFCDSNSTCIVKRNCFSKGRRIDSIVFLRDSISTFPSFYFPDAQTHDKINTKEIIFNFQSRLPYF